MYKSDKVGVDVCIDGMLGELSYDIEHEKRHVEACKKAYEEAHELALQAMNESCDAYYRLITAELDLEKLEIIDKHIRQARTDVDEAYNDWLKWRKA